MATSASWLQQWPDWASQTVASSQCRKLNAEASQAPNAYTLTSFGTHQGQAEARKGPFPTSRGAVWTGSLLADTVPSHWPCRPCLHSHSPWPAWPGWHCHLPPGPRVHSSERRAEPSPSVCVYVCGATSPPAPGRGLHTHGMHPHAGLGTRPWSSCLSWTLCKHFCACQAGANWRGLVPSLRD